MTIEENGTVTITVKAEDIYKSLAVIEDILDSEIKSSRVHNAMATAKECMESYWIEHFGGGSGGMTIGQLVKKYCEDNYITRWEFAARVGMTDFSINRLIRDNRLPAVPYIKNIAKALDMTFMELIHEHYSAFNGEGEK